MPIQVNELSKHFRLFKREAGLSGALRSFFNRKYENFHALTDISVKIEDGEILGILGENGAGKTTLIKLLVGLLHPSSGVEKEYRATVDVAPSQAQLSQLRAGPTLDDGPTSPPRRVTSDGLVVTLVIKEGRKRQVRRMLKEVGLRCRHLDRVRFGNLTYKDLRPGERRSLSEAELAELRKLCPSRS